MVPDRCQTSIAPWRWQYSKHSTVVVSHQFSYLGYAWLNKIISCNQNILDKQNCLCAHVGQLLCAHVGQLLCAHVGQLFCAHAGQFPAPIVLGLIFDQACLVWQQQKCSDDVGACWIYDSSYLSTGMFYLSILVKLISCVTFLAALCVYKAPKSAGAVDDETLTIDVNWSNIIMTSSHCILGMS